MFSISIRTVTYFVLPFLYVGKTGKVLTWRMYRSCYVGNHVEETVHATLSASIHAENHVKVESIGKGGLYQQAHLESCAQHRAHVFSYLKLGAFTNLHVLVGKKI